MQQHLQSHTLTGAVVPFSIAVAAMPCNPACALLTSTFLYVCTRTQGLSPGSDTYQKLVKEAAALGPLVEGYQELRHKQQDVSLAVCMCQCMCVLADDMQEAQMNAAHLFGCSAANTQSAGFVNM